MKSNYKWIYLFLVLAVTALACNLTASGGGIQATAQALSEAVRLTATAAAAQTSGSGPGIETAQAAATEQTNSLEETRAAMEALNAEALEATRSAFAPVIAELPNYGVDPNEGFPAWIHPPVKVEVSGYMQYDYANQFIGTVVRDFVISADITWNTTTGLSGCGFALRSDGNEESLNQYLTIATRGASGHVIFGTMAAGEVVTGQDIYAYGIDPDFDWRNDTTNRLTVVGRGNRFILYSNGTLLGEVDPSAPPPQPYFPPPPQEPADKSDADAMAKFLQQQAEYQEIVRKIRADHQARVNAYEAAETEFERGFIALVALSESGRTACHFENAWLWLLEE
jgi:predicted small secreted protein